MPQTLLNPSFESWAPEATEGGNAPASWTRAVAGSANLVANGGFGSNDLTSWTAAAGWAGTTGKAVHTAGIADTTALAQNISLSNTLVYIVRFTISGRTAGTLTPGLENIAANAAFVAAKSDNMSYYFEVTANATDATSLLSFTPTATFDGAIDDISVRPKLASDIRQAGDHSKCDDYPSLDAIDMCVDSTPNVVTLTGTLTLVEAEAYHFYFKHMRSHDDPAIVAADAHYATVTIRTSDSGHYLQSDLSWAAGAYAFPISSLFNQYDRFSKRFTATPAGHTAYTIVFSSNDLHGSSGYLLHQYIDNVHCEVDES